MGKITKEATSKHDGSLSPALSELISSLTTGPLAELPNIIASVPLRWPLPRGDLYNWIKPLNRFDEILESFNRRYELDSHPQTISFGTALLQDSDPTLTEEKLQELGFGPEGDRELIEAILKFTKLLLEKCGNRILYNSGDRLNHLLNTISLSLLQCTLRVSLGLAQRYRDRFHGLLHLPTPSQHHYGLDLGRLETLIAPVSPAPAISTKRGPLSPPKAPKMKPVSSTRTRRASTTGNPNDFRSLCSDDAQTNGSQKASLASKADWADWSGIRMTYIRTPANAGDEMSVIPATTIGDPISPVQSRRVSSHGASRLRRMSTSDEPSNEAQASATWKLSSDVNTLELSAEDLASQSICQALDQNLVELPKSYHFELLHKLRIAYGITSYEQRQLLLSVKLLAMANLTCVTSDDTFMKKVFGQDPDVQHRRRLIQQLISLLQDNDKFRSQIPRFIQTASLEVLSAMIRQKHITGEICSALQVSSAHGVLLLLSQKGLKDLEQDDDSSDNHDGDEWRDMVFSMLKTCIEAASVNNRLPESFVPASLMSCYVGALDNRSAKGLRIHLRVLETFRIVFHYVKDGISFLSTHNAFDKVSELLEILTKSSMELRTLGKGFPSSYKTPNTDYQIPYVQQQTIRACIDLINDVGSHQGPQADRVLRSLIDSQKLLSAFRMVLEPKNLRPFGAHTWSEVVKCICGFMHNEPTSYTILAESGLPACILATVTGENDLAMLQASGANDETTSPTATPEEISPPIDESTSDQPPQTSRKISPEPTSLDQHFPASSSVMTVLAQAFGAICLTNAGFELFQKSGALEKFFTIFESPPYIKAMKNGNTLNLLGSNFDELVRHHPQLRESVMSTLMVTVARVRWMCRSRAWETGSGPKLWANTNGQHGICGGDDAMLLEIRPPVDLPRDSDKSKLDLTLPDGSILLADPAVSASEQISIFDKQDSVGLEPDDYLSCIMGFLASFFENQQHCTYFVENGGADLILDCMTLPTLPIADVLFGSQGGNTMLDAVVHDIAEVKPHLVLPVVVQRALFACGQVQHFVDNQPGQVSSYFASLVGGEPADHQDDVSRYVSENGTRLAKSLTVLVSHLQTLTEIFAVSAYGSRGAQAALFSQVNLADIYSELCRQLGPISAGCLRESITLQNNIPQEWLRETQPDTENNFKNDVKKILGLRDGPSSDENPSPTTEQEEQQQVQDDGSGSAQPVIDPMSIDNSQGETSLDASLSRDSAAFKNAKALRRLMTEAASAITHFLSTMGRGLVAKRRMETIQKQNVHRVASAIASALQSLLDPPFLTHPDLPVDDKAQLKVRFAYLVVVLDMINDIVLDFHSQTSDQMGGCVTSVLLAFKNAGGMQLLHRVGSEFYEQLKKCEVAHESIHVMTTANAGLKICLDILEGVTSSQFVTDSQQSVFLKNPDQQRPFYFQPAQLLLELRLEALPLTRLIWDSDYADQASQAVVERLILILKHVLDGDNEADAYKNAESRPKLTTHIPKKWSFADTKVSELVEQGFDESLAQEAVFRCSGHQAAAKEYCKAFQTNPLRQRCPVPAGEIESGPSSASNPSPSPHGRSSNVITPSMDTALAEVLTNIRDETASTGPSADSTDEHDASPMRISSILNSENETAVENASERQVTQQSPSPSSPESETFTVDDMNRKRDLIRKDLVERCNNILNNHQSLTFELSELIISAAKRLPEEAAKAFREEATTLLIHSLLSLQAGETIEEELGKRIAASAHLIGLLLQDQSFYESAEPLLCEDFSQMLQFLNLPPQDGRAGDISFPWAGPILLLFERMLSRDSEPAKVEWRVPQDLETTSEASIVLHEVLDHDQKELLFKSLMEMLPRINKDQSLALSVSRILVILTRDRELAAQLANRRNIQRLFVMVKQLSAGTNDRLQASVMIILRHLVEDPDTLRHVMQSEVAAYFNQRQPPRNIDAQSFVRDVHHLALRSPEIFLEVANEMVKLQSFEGRDRHPLVLRKMELGDDGKITEAANAGTSKSDDGPSNPDSNELTTLLAESEPKQSPRSTEYKPAIIENPDGVIHFLISELLAYKDVEDKDPSINPTETSNSNGTTMAVDESRETSLIPPSPGSTPMPIPQPKPRAAMKPEEHPVYVYRCFLLQCLTELLLSYNRTKLEFINYSRKADPMASTPSKPRSGVLNYLLNSLVPSAVEVEESVAYKKKSGVSSGAMRVVVALCSKTREVSGSAYPSRYSWTKTETDDEPDLAFVRRFVVEHVIKAFKDAMSTTEASESRFARLLGLTDLFHRLLTSPLRDASAMVLHSESTPKALGRVMFEKNVISLLTSSLADIDLTATGANRVIKHILKPLNALTIIAENLSLSSPTPLSSALGSSEEDDLSSATSVSDIGDPRENTPDLFQNSSLGMMDANRGHQSGSDTDNDADEEMYDEEYGDEMDYEEEVQADPVDDGEVVSDEEIDGNVQGAIPLEGVPGNVGVGFEFVVDGQEDEMEGESASEDDGDSLDEDDDDGEDEDEDEDDDGTEDEDDEDIEIEEDDHDMGGEINADDENDSLDDGEPAEEAWQDEEDDDVNYNDHTAGPRVLDVDDEPRFRIAEGGQGSALNNLLQVLNGGAPTTGSVEVAAELDTLLRNRPTDDNADDEDENQAEDDDDDNDMDEDEDVAFETFNEMADGQDDILDDHHRHHVIGFDNFQFEVPLSRRHRHSHLRHGGHIPSFISRRLGPGGDLHHHVITHPPRRPAVHGRPGADDGTNPLLQRTSNPDVSAPFPNSSPLTLPAGIDIAGLPPLPSNVFGMLGPGGEGIHGNRSHGRMLDAIMHVLQRGGGDMDVLRDGRVEISLNMGPPPTQPFLRPPTSGLSRAPGTSSQSFFIDPKSTMSRWQEEVKILYGNTYIELIPRVSKALLWKLVPLAQEEERERRKKEQEETARRREETERQKVENEKLKKEEADREAEAKAEADRQAAEAAAAAAAQEAERSEATEQPQEAAQEQVAEEPGEDANAEAMEGVQTTNQESTSQPVAAVADAEQSTSAENVPRVVTTIRGRELDISHMSIDAEYLEALPEELREEVIMQQYAAQRAQAQDEGNAAGEIDEEFLNALPVDIREELRQQEINDRRRREREEARRRTAEQGGVATQPEEMDNENFLATLDPNLRRIILAEQPPEVLQHLDPRHAAEGRAHARSLFRHAFPVGGREPRDGFPVREEATRDSKRQVVQMIDRSGVATLLRPMFVPWHGSIKDNMKSVLQRVCGHRQTRFEVVNLLLAILREVSADVNAVERSLANLSLRAKSAATSKTPQSLKRTLSFQPTAGISEEMTPVMVIHQCLVALNHLSRSDNHVRSIFLREVDVTSNVKTPSKKGKGKESRTTKYPLNDLLGLLDRKLLSDSSDCLHTFAELLLAVTQPLTTLLEKKQPLPEEKPSQSAESSATPADGEESTHPTDQAPAAPIESIETTEDVTMGEAPNPPAQTQELAASESVSGPTDKSGETAPKEEESKSKKPFEPPTIPGQNLHLLVGIFTGQDTGRETFNNTSAAMTNLCAIPGTRSVFITELVNHAISLSQVILKDLDELLPLIQEAQYGTDLQSIASNKFSPANSDQAKLLRVLQALDAALHPKVSGKKVDDIPGFIEPTDVDWSRESLKLGPLWSKLSECLHAMREKENIVSFATILLPLIESLLVVCKNTSLDDAPLARQAREQSITSPEAESFSGVEKLFFTFTSENRKILNEIVRQNPKLMQGNGGFGLLVKNSKVLDFDNKRSFFSKQIHTKRNEPHRRPVEPLQINVRRDNIFNDSYKSLYYKSAEEMKFGKLNIRFHGEEGVDAGGVTREWFQVLARGMFDPNYALWEPVAADKTTFHPSRLSGVNDQHLSFFKFIGRFIGKALFEGRVLDCHFSRAVYKKMLGKETSLRDMESLDIDYYKSLLWILENDITDIISEDFSVVSDDFGAERVIDLIPDGRNVAVTQDNKHEYVQKLVEYRLTGSVSEQLEHFLRGFHDIIPADLISIFNEQELELLISGLPEVDVDDWKANTTYHGYNANSPQVMWYWRLIRAMSNEERAKMLQFVTGTSKVPLNGFKELEGLNGATKMSIIMAPGATTQLPTSHTCFNQLDLPKYDSYEELRTRCLTAINLGAEYFGFA